MVFFSRALSQTLTLSQTLKQILFLIFSLGIWMGCSDQVTDQVTNQSTNTNATPALLQVQQSVIYGDDNRLEYYQLTEGVIKQRARESSIAIMNASKIIENTPDQFSLSQSSTLGVGNELCEDQLFFTQPKASFCSGTLVAPNLVLTAGHCIDDEVCADLRIVFRYLYLNENQLAPLRADQIYRCQSFLSAQNDGAGDFAWIELDRPVVDPFQPAPIASNQSELSIGQNINLMGSPNGIPMKIDTHSKITTLDPNQRSAFLYASMDAFAGNSGSGVYDDQGKLRGILVRGRTDYQWNATRQCNEVNTIPIDSNGLPLDHLPSETITHVSIALSALCTADPQRPICSEHPNLPDPNDIDPNALFCEPDAFEDNDVVSSATILPEGQMVLVNHCEDAVDYYQIVVDDPTQSYDIETYPLESSSDTIAYLYDLDGMTVLVEDDDGGSAYGSLIEDWQPNQSANYPLLVGTYRDQFGSNRMYGMMIRKHCSADIYEHDDFPIPEIEINIGSFKARHSLCDEDWIPIQLQAGVAYLIETINLENTDTLLELYQASGALILRNDNRHQMQGQMQGMIGDDRSSAIQFTPMQSGKYWLKISQAQQIYGGNQIYEIKVSSAEVCDLQDNDVDGIIDEGIELCLACLSDQAEPDQSIAQASPIEIGKIYARNHCYDSEDYSQFLIDDLNLRFDFETYPYDPLSNTLLEVYDLNGRALASDLETTDPKSFIQNLGFESSGIHYMRVAQTDDRFGEHLNYGVLVRNHCEDDLYEHDDWASIAKLRAGEDWSEIRSLCDEDWIALNLRGQNRYVIESADLQNVDTYFELYQFLDQAPFVSNDDGGEGYASKIIVYAPTDVQLYLRVKTYSDTYGGINQYRLSFGLVPMEICDGRDNDIDGMTDEQLLNACGTCGDIPTEICDEVDNDCDGLIDENVTNRCGKCGQEPQELCDGRDNDCDGLSDEMILNACGRCGPTPSERCDGMDNDCDLKTDEGCPGYDMFQAQVDMGEIDQNLQTTDLDVIDLDQDLDQFKSSAPDYRIIDSKPTIDLAIMEGPETGHLGGGCSQAKVGSRTTLSHHIKTNLSDAHLFMLLAIFGCIQLMRMKIALSFYIGLILFVLAILPTVGYVQAQPLSDVIAECADCHPSQVKGFLETGMGKSLYQPKDAKIIEDFSSQKATIIHPQTKAVYKASIDENGKWWQIESTQDGTYERKVEVKYIVGSGNHTRSYIGEINGELVEMPLTWYVEKKIWDMSPGYEGKKHFRFERPIKPECIFCHNDLSKIKAFSYAEYEAPFKEGISCQRCHGDASLHLKSQNGQKIEDQEIHAFLKKIQREDLLQTKNTTNNRYQNLSEKVQTIGLSVLNLSDLIREISSDLPSQNHDQLQILKSSALGENLILNPKHLSTQRAYEICQQCHLTGNARVLYPGYTWDHYDPNLPLHQYMAIYMPDRKSVSAQNDSVFGISSHAERLQLSACFQKSPNQDLSCSKCHNPHQKNTREDQKTACLSCHKMEDCDAKHQIKADQICSDCHMNKGNTSDIPHVNFTDHWIRKVPTQTPAFKLDYAPLINTLATPKDASQTLALAMSGIASIEYARLQSKNHGDWLDAKVRLEEAEKSIDSKSLQVYSAVKLGLARVHLAFEDFHSALSDYDAYLRLEPNDSIARLEYADLLMKVGKMEESKQAYLTVIEKNPQNYNAYNGLANLYQVQKNWTQAENYYQLAHQKAPHVAEIAFNHAYLMMHQAKFADAEKWLREGIRRDGLKGEGYFHLGVLAIKQNQKDSGLAWFEKALSIDDSLKDVYWVRGRIYTFEKKWALAQKDFEKLLSLDPKHVGGYLDYSRIFVEQKKKQEAIFLLERGFLQTNAKDLWDAIEFIKQMKD